MKRTLRNIWVLGFIASLFSPVTASAVSTNPTPDCSAVTTCTSSFSYTGDYYAWTVPYTGNFILESWGAQGGGTGTNYWGVGGNGGYAKGTAALTAGTILYIYVGQQGFLSDSSMAFNGGGWGTKTNGYSSYTGGGATHIATTSGLLSTLASSTSSILIVAGGGGGAAGSGNSSWSAYAAAGGAGGGTNGLAGSHSNGETPYRKAGTGGTSSAGGASGDNGGQVPANAASFGRGANGTASQVDGISGGGGGGGYYGGGAGSDAGGGGGGGSGYTGTLTSTTLTAGNATMPNPSGGTMTGKSGNGFVKITYDNAPSISNFVSSLSTPTSTTSPIDFTFSTSQNVTTVANSDFSNSGTATGCSFAISASSGTSFTLTVSSCSEGTLIPQVLAGSLYGTVTSTSGPTSNTSTLTPIVIDRTAPTISSVTAPANKTYIPSETPTFTVAFSESVTVTGTPRLTFTVGSTTEYANFVSMSDSKTALFRYTVATDPLEFDSDGIAISTSLDLNSGTIRDLATNSLSNLTFSAPTLTSVLVAQPAAAPTIDSITATSGQLAIYFTPGAARGSTTTTYQYSSNGGAFTNRPTGTTASPLILTGLTNGTGYTIRLRATTNAGAGESSTAVTETPTSITVTGDATLTLTYGSSASTSAYSASGGTNSFTWSLGSSLTGITLSGTTVTASSSTPAGTYTQTVRATDTNSQVGSKTLTITVNKASTAITIALPNSATSAALGGAVTITATVPRAGSVNFMLGGTTISGCGSASAASTTATCSWTPNALGSVSLTATFTPTDAANFETSTTTTLTITVINGVSTVTLSLTGGTTTPPKGQTINIIAAVDQAGRITFLIDGKRIPGCNNRVANVGNVSCSWKPAIQKETVITARLVPTNNVYNPSTSSLSVRVVRRSGTR